jgi:hypothetical protein
MFTAIVNIIHGFVNKKLEGYVDSLRDNVKRSIGQKLRNQERGFRRLRLATFTSRMKRESPISRLIRCVRRWCGSYSRNTPRAAQFHIPAGDDGARDMGLNNSRGNKGLLIKSHIYTHPAG